MASFTLETSDAGQARRFEFHTPNVTIGRDRAADFTLDHPTVSRQHAVVSWDGQYYRLVVLSRGGLTAIDGQQVGGEVPLYDGSLLMFGQLQFVFRSAHAAPRQAPHLQHSQSSGVQPVFPQTAFPTASTSGMHASPNNSGLYQMPAGMPMGGETAEFSAWSPSGSFPVPRAQQQPAAPPPTTAEPVDGLVTWDDIAASAEAQGENAELTNFERLQRAQELADAQADGVNPVKAIIALLLASMVMIFFFYGGKEAITEKPVEEAKGPSDDPTITWMRGDIDCIGTADCRSRALTAFEIGKQTLERQEADIVNLYEGFKQLEKADALLEKGEVEPRPKEMAEAEALKLRAAADMKTFYLTTRAGFLDKKNRGNHDKMAAQLRKIQAYFPDERLNYHRWAQQRVIEMKEEGIYPNEVY